ncbi:protein FAM200A-like [Erpetoichthys calabaricus]|uniref:protein FAM200A-like n=1 Tax=Erpetoichthys calabaricus TaxID=27687 RepID=UPI0010A03679|nr:protein FAM200A-like [Erpetoichthys calabaricus]
MDFLISYTIAEDLILPAAMDMVREVLDQSAADKLKTIPLLNDTISRRIEEMSDNIKQQTIARIKASGHFALKMDEFTDITNKAVLLVYVRHVWDRDLQELFLCTRELTTSTTAEDIFSSMDLYLSSVGLRWDMCICITTDGAASMTGKNLGIVRRILEKALNATWNHCFLHRENPGSKGYGTSASWNIKNVIQAVNYIKRSAKNTRCFQKLCQDLGSELVQVLYHAEVCWLSREKVLSHFYELRAEIAAFLAQNNSPLADLFSNSVWLAQVAYLADVFEQLNTLNVSVQGRGHNIFEQYDKFNVFKKKISLWASHVSKNQLDMYPNGCHEGQQLDAAGKHVMKKMITTHLNKLLERFNDYFPKKQRDDDWIRDPFEINMESAMLPSNEESQLVEPSCDCTLKKKFMEVSLFQFWCSTLMGEYPCLATRAVKILLPFSTTNLFECGFSALVQLKTKHRNRLDIEYDLAVALSTVTPEFETLVRSKKHAQFSH